MVTLKCVHLLKIHSARLYVLFYLTIGQVGMTSLQVNCSLTEVNASVFIAVFSNVNKIIIRPNYCELHTSD